MSRITLGESRERVVKDQWLFTAGRKGYMCVCMCHFLLKLLLHLKFTSNILQTACLGKKVYVFKFQFELHVFQVVEEMNGLIGQWHSYIVLRERKHAICMPPAVCLLVFFFSLYSYFRKSMHLIRNLYPVV